MEPIKHRIAHYWSHRAKDFQGQRIREFSSDKHQLWLNEIGPYLPGKETLRVLDVGTGTGFFSFLMAAEGHDALGIDLTEEMIEGAERTSEILGLNASAYLAEIFRGGIQAIDEGQIEAARSLGLSSAKTMRLVVFPQAIKIMIPSLMNQFITSLKDTAILSAISVNELTMTSKTIIARNFKAFEVYSYAAIMYIILITVLTIISKKVEKKLAYDRR